MRLNKIGVWGLGIVGKSAIRYLYSQGYELGCMDKRTPNPAEQTFLNQHNTCFYSEDQKDLFFSTYDTIIPSAGIDLRPYAQHAHKWLGELDFFSSLVSLPSIAITGSLGKTSVTHLISQALLASGLKIATAGNIGVGLLDIVSTDAQWLVAELSSFQLELSNQFAPDLAVITNLYPNHLDRHESTEKYIKVKCNLLRYQKDHQRALVNAECAEQIRLELGSDRPLSTFSLDKPTYFTTFDTLYYYDRSVVIKEHQGSCVPLASKTDMPPISFALNWLTVVATLDTLGGPLSSLRQINTQLPDHRLQHVGKAHQIDFYDDSKSTVPESTLAAVNQLAQRPIILLLGGISKGINRQPLVQALAHKVKSVHCFGVEAHQLASFCDHVGIPASPHTTLESAFSQAVQDAQKGDQILLSPSGASYDLFTSYSHRGQVFQELVRQHLRSITEEHR